MGRLPMILAEILFGAAFTIAAAFALGRICLLRVPAPLVMALPVGGAVLSTLVYFLLLAGLAGQVALAALGVIAMAGFFPRRPRAKPVAPDLRVMAILAPYAVFYAVNALAPEVQPDAAGYHLGLVAEYARRAGFPHRVDFYGILPQGMEMLYLFAFAFGKHSAAKLVHFSFLLATAPLIVAVGRRLGVPETASAIAAGLYVIAPVAGISGTSAYTDAALVAAILGCVYFLASAIAEDDARFLFPAGILGGFAYAIKLSALLVPACAVAALILVRRRVFKRAAIFSASAALIILPWMLRAAILTGNPLAPLFNAVFPNPHFSVTAERDLARTLRTYEGFTFASAPWQLTVGGAGQSVIGAVFLLLPVGLLALRKPAGRRVWIAAALLAAPWFLNVGARFLMPALPFFALAITLALPRPLAWAALILHAVASWPAVMTAYEPAWIWRLREFPWRAALRIEPEADYLRDRLPEYRAAEMIARHTPPDARILALVELPAAYLDREVWQYWQSAEAIQGRHELVETHGLAAYPLVDWSAEWPERELVSVRFRLPRTATFEWEIHEIELLRRGDRVPVARDWMLEAWPNLYDASQALDGSLPSRWRTEETAPAGSYFQIDFAPPVALDGAALIAHWTFPGLETYGRTRDGAWIVLSRDASSNKRAPQDLRRLAIRRLKRAGFDYLAIPSSGSHPHATLGKDMVDRAADWGVVHLASFDTIALLKL